MAKRGAPWRPANTEEDLAYILEAQRRLKR